MLHLPICLEHLTFENICDARHLHPSCTSSSCRWGVDSDLQDAIKRWEKSIYFAPCRSLLHTRLSLVTIARRHPPCLVLPRGDHVIDLTCTSLWYLEGTRRESPSIQAVCKILLTCLRGPFERPLALQPVNNEVMKEINNAFECWQNKRNQKTPWRGGHFFESRSEEPPL